MRKDSVLTIRNVNIAGNELHNMAAQQHVLPKTRERGQLHGLGVACTG